MSIQDLAALVSGLTNDTAERKAVLEQIEQGKFESHGRPDVLRAGKRIAARIDPAEIGTDKPFPRLLRFLSADNDLKFQTIRFLCGGNDYSTFEELKGHEVVIGDDDHTLTGRPSEFDCVVRHLIWCVVGPASQMWFRMAHTPEALLNNDSVLTEAVRMTEAQIRAKEEMFEYFSQHCEKDTLVRLIQELQIGGDIVQTCPYVEISVQRTPSKIAKETKCPFPKCALDRPPSFSCRRRLVGYADLLRPQNKLPASFAAAMAACDHDAEFILMIRQQHKIAVFVVAKDLILMDPDPTHSSTQLHVNSE